MQRDRDGAPALTDAERDEIPQLVESKRIFDGVVLGLRVDTLRGGDGRTFERETVEYRDAVVVVPVTADGHLLMVRQYRHAAGAWLLEMPAGSIDDRDGTPEEAAQRELREETGHRGTLERIGGWYLAPGYATEFQHIFLARDLVEDALDADEDEDLRVERVPVADVARYVDEGWIRDAKSIAALWAYLRRGPHPLSPSPTGGEGGRDT
jgi:ADP-ribose pyrophosphatase